jgi:hypothetical protein
VASVSSGIALRSSGYRAYVATTGVDGIGVVARAATGGIIGAAVGAFKFAPAAS